MPDTANRLADRCIKWREVIEGAAQKLGAFLPDVDIPAMVFVGMGTSNGWATTLNGRITVFLAAELAPPPPLLPVLVAHEATHAVQSTLASAWDGDDYTLGALAFAEGLATHVSALAYPGLPPDGYLWFDSDHAAWLEECAAAWPTAIAVLADELETSGGAAERRFFSSDPRVERDGIPTRFGYYAGWCVVQELARTKRTQELVAGDMAAAHQMVAGCLEAASPLTETRGPGPRPVR